MKKIPGPTGPAGQDGQDGTADTTHDNQQEVIFYGTKHPTIGTYPGEGIRIWDSAQQLMRNLIGQNGVFVSLHADGNRIIVDGPGSGGIDPAYMTLANKQITMHHQQFHQMNVVSYDYFYPGKQYQQLSV